MPIGPDNVHILDSVVNIDAHDFDDPSYQASIYFKTVLYLIDPNNDLTFSPSNNPLLLDENFGITNRIFDDPTKTPGAMLHPTKLKMRDCLSS